MFKRARKASLAGLVMALLITALAGVFASPASANVSPPYQATRTVVMHFGTGMTAGSPWYNAAVSRVNYINGIGGKPVKIVLGSCQPGFACVNVQADHYGQSWTGAWVGGPTCNYSGTAYSSTDYHFECIWDSVNKYVGNVYFDTTDSVTQFQREALACHEFGHMEGLQHAGGQTCMQATIDASPSSAVSNQFQGSETLDLYDIYVNHRIPNCCPQP